MALEQAIARGSEQLKAGKLAEAQRLFREALELDRDNVRVLALLGLTYFRGNQFDEARPIYETLVDRAPTDASHRLNLGLVYLKLSEADKAIHSLEASRSLDPSQGRAVSYLGLAYARAGRYAEAYRSFLLAGQNELASEIEGNLTPAERDGIHAQLGRSPHTGGATPAVARTQTPVPGAAMTATPPTGVPLAPVPSRVAATPPMGVTTSPANTPAPAATATPPMGIVTGATSVPGFSAPAASSPSSGGSSEPSVARTTTPEPRTRPPSAPPKGSRTKSDELGPSAAQFSQPEIVIERLTADTPKLPTVAARSGASITDAGPQPLRASEGELRMSDSMQFVLPREEPVEKPLDGRSMISMAVKAAVPTSTASAPARTASGGLAPRPLSELATDDLVRADDGKDPFEITTGGALIIRVTDRVMTRLDGVHVTGGDLAYELATRRSRGHQTEERFDYNATPLHTVSGSGYLIAVRTAGSKAEFVTVVLDDDILYLREDLVFAFESTLRWESGNVPGLRGKLPVVQFRGDGALAARLARPLVRVKLPSSGVLFVDADRLAGWIGRVIPRAVVPPSGGPLGTMCVECTGEGIVLVEPAPEGSAPTMTFATTRRAPPPVSERVEPSRDAPEPAPPEPATPRAIAVDGESTSGTHEVSTDAVLDAIDRLDEI